MPISSRTKKSGLVVTVLLAADVNVTRFQDYAGAFASGYTPEQVDRTLRALRDASGIELAILWDYYDENGFGGSSDYVVAYQGEIYELEDVSDDAPDFASFLNGNGQCPETMKFRLDRKREYEADSNFNYAVVDKSVGGKRGRLTRSGMTDANRLALAQKVAALVFERFESFHDDNVGPELAYLLTAIIDPPSETSSVDWTKDGFAQPPALLSVLKQAFDPDSPLWEFIILDDAARAE